MEKFLWQENYGAAKLVGGPRLPNDWLVLKVSQQAPSWIDFLKVCGYTLAKCQNGQF